MTAAQNSGFQQTREKAPPVLTYIDQRLTEWGRWSLMRSDGGGWQLAPQVKYREWEPRALPVGPAAPVDEQCEKCWECEAGVGWLLVTHRRVGLVVTSVYRDRLTWSAGMIATWLHVSRMTLYRDLDRAHVLLWEYLLDRACGLVPPQVERLRERAAA